MRDVTPSLPSVLARAHTRRNTQTHHSHGIQLHINTGAGTNGLPLKRLFGFERVHVKAGQSVNVYLYVAPFFVLFGSVWFFFVLFASVDGGFVCAIIHTAMALLTSGHPRQCSADECFFHLLVTAELTHTHARAFSVAPRAPRAPC